MNNVTENELRIVFWETTSGCNLKCIHCRATATNDRSPDELTTEESIAFIDDLASFAKPILILSGGEPLYRPDIFDIASHASHAGLITALASNGTLITPEVAEKIKESGIRRVSISLDGAGPETHDAFRGIEGAFDAAISGIEHLKATGMSAQINTTVAKHNIGELPKLLDLAINIGVDALHLFLLVPVGCGVDIAEEQMITPEEYERVLNWAYDMSKKTSLDLKMTCAPHFFRVMRQRAKKDGGDKKVAPKGHKMSAATKGCLAGQSVCFVSYKGDVFPCGYLPVSAGNVRQQRIKDIWVGGGVFKELRDVSKLKGKCGHCEYRKICGGCRARAYGQTGDYLDPEPYCIYTPGAMVS